MDPSKPSPLFQRLLIFILADLFGMFCLVLGVVWLVAGYRFPLMRFPNNSSEAFVSVAGGLAVSAWAAVKLLSALRDRAE
ncbi:MAG: hypothetical protein BWY57_02315 [Betaproteobacteria bacterium ADurb.Bin341]|nr:MAG: hypothetical protein BWY57_02315 [Betaproteobacteria bacterium ADurb.Bin341]